MDINALNSIDSNNPLQKSNQNAYKDSGDQLKAGLDNDTVTISFDAKMRKFVSGLDDDSKNELTDFRSRVQQTINSGSRNLSGLTENPPESLTLFAEEHGIKPEAIVNQMIQRKTDEEFFYSIEENA